MTDVSVVIPTHNRRELLDAALQSALAQRDVSLEVVVVDDGSRDSTSAHVLGMTDPRIRLLRHEVPLGVAAARNAGARSARGTWIALLDDDDMWAPNKLRRQLAAADRAGASWVYAGVVEVDHHGRLLGGGPPPNPEALVASLRQRNPMPAGSSNVIVRADLLHAVHGFDPTLRHIADWDLWLRLAARSSPAVVREPLVAYRQHSGQATLDTYGMLREARVLAARHGVDVNAVRRWAAWSHLREGRRLKAASCYVSAARDGDLSSLGRLLVVLAHPRPTRTGLQRPGHAGDVRAWHEQARRWLGSTAAGVAQDSPCDV